MRVFIRHTLIIAAVVLAAGCARVKPDEIGVRTINFGRGEGIVKTDYAPGFHRFLWPLDTWHRLPSTVQRIRFARGDMQGAGNEGLQVNSAGGDRVILTAEVLFRIADGEAHHVLQETGTDERYREFVRGLTQDAARVLFGRLHTEAFYDENARETARQEAVTLLRERLKPRGIELINFLVEAVEFDRNYETLIKQKKLADQRVELEKAKSRAAEEEGKVAKIGAETTAKVAKIERENEAEITKKTTEVNLQIGTMRAEAEKYASALNADAALYKSQKEADGQKLLKEAEAEGTQRLNAALLGIGGRNLVALEAAKRLNLTDVAFPSSGFEWFNPHDMAIRLGASEDVEENVKPAKASR